MRRYLLGVALALSFGATAAAQDDQSLAIEGVIQGQMDAFLDHDVARAFSFASPNIKRIFGSSDQFGAMVQQGYPMVWNPANVRYLDLREIDGTLWQKVMVTDRSGAIHILDYAMIQTAEGWQIDAVQILEIPQIGA